MPDIERVRLAARAPGPKINAENQRGSRPIHLQTPATTALELIALSETTLESAEYF